MILQALCEYYQRKALDPQEALAPFGFEEKEIPFLIVLNSDGKFIQLLDTRDKDAVGKLRSRSHLVPKGWGRQGSKSYEIAYPLWDHYGYVLAQPKLDKPDAAPNPKDVEMAAKQHKAFCNIVDSIYEVFPNDKGVFAVKAFLANEVEKDKLKQSADWLECLKIKGCNLSFKLVDAEYLVCQSPDVKRWVAQSIKSDDSDTGVCLVSGERASIARLHPVIKGVGGTQSGGAAIASFNKDSFNSWNKEQGANSPVSEKTAFEYTTALNYLLRTQCPNRFQMGEISVVCWAEKNNSLEQAFPNFFTDPPSDNPDAGVAALKHIAGSLHNGAYQQPDGKDKFYLLGLSPNAARIAVRFWQVGTVAEFSERIGQWFSDIEISKSEKQLVPALKSLLRTTALLGEDKNMSPHLVGETVRAILQGLPLPENLLQSVIKRIKAEKGAVTFYRAALIKACLNRKFRFYRQTEQEVTVGLNKDEQRVGYRLGRLFAVLEKLQEDANPGLNATIRDRYYSSASCTPKSVFGTLMRLHTHHLKKLPNPAWQGAAEKNIGEIMDGIKEFPSHLNLEEQGLFAVGYYHQRQHRFVKNESTEGAV